jgi:hypothetical protein
VEIPTEESVAWQSRVVEWIQSEEKDLAAKHLIGQNVANFRLAVRARDLAPGVGLVNFHYAYPEAATLNLALHKIIGCNETGFAGAADATYRRQAWNFLFSGGGLYNNLDYSFTVEHPDGTDPDNEAPGGGSPSLRKQLGSLSRFLNGLELERLRPDPTLVQACDGATARVLSSRGSQGGKFVAAMYLEGRGPSEVVLELPAGRFQVSWVKPIDGSVIKKEEVRSEEAGWYKLMSPDYENEVAVTISRVE